MRSIFTLLFLTFFVALQPVSAQGLDNPIISEFHYQNVGTDQGEKIEIFGKSGTNLANYRIYLYDKDGDIYYQQTLSGIIPIMVQKYGINYGVSVFSFNDIQNGKAGISLTTISGQVLEWISYGKGTITADVGPAKNTTSDNVGVTESDATPVGASLWRPSASSTKFGVTTQNSFGLVNTGLVPITLKQFSVSLKDKEVTTKWIASSTHPDSYYEVERSADQKNFKVLARLKAVGVGEFNYSYTDSKPLKGNAYYRLKLIDPDEMVKYSTVARIKWNEKAFFLNNIFPSVARSIIQVQINSDERYSGKIELYDLSGRMVQKENIRIVEGNGNYPLSIGSLKSGTYIIRITAGSELLTGKFVRE